MDEATLLTLATGPTSSLILLLGIGLGLWRVASQKVAPAAARWVDSHLAQVDALIAENRANREAWLESMRDFHAQGQRIEAQVEVVGRKVGGLYGRIDQLSNTKQPEMK